MKAFCCLGAWVVCLLAGAAHAAVVSGPAVNPANGHSYYLLSFNNCTGAQTEASTLGGNLVTINDLTENAWIADQFRGPAATTSCWIGLNDSNNDGIYTWADGDLASFRNWIGDGPTVNSDDYVAIVFARSDLWVTNPNGTSSFGQRLSIAEVVPEPATVSLLALTLIFSAGRPRRLGN